MKKHPFHSELIREIEKEAARCARCGACQSVCPVFRVIRQEQGAARGKIALADAFLRHDIGKTRRLKKIMQNCLLCLACKENCPNNVDTELVIKNLRTILETSGRGISAQRLLGNVFKSPATFKSVLKLDNLVARNLSGQIIPEESGLRMRFPASLLFDDRFFFRSWSFGNKRGLQAAKTGSKNSCLFFVGCTTRYVKPEIGIAAIDLMSALGYKVIIPDEQQCCGFAASVSGRRDIARELEKRLMELIANYPAEFIVTVCPTCNRKIGETLEKGDSDISVHDISKFLTQYIEQNTPGGLACGETIVTYHESCHLSRGLGVREEPRYLLREYFGNRFREMERADQCCGLGGLYGITHPAVSSAILEDKMKMVERTGCGYVFTGCPACVLQLEAGVKRAGLNVEVRHLAELVRFRP